MCAFGEMGFNVRRIAVAVALLSTVLAISLIAVAFSRTGQRTGACALFQSAGRGVQYYFIPASQAKKLAAQQQHLPARLDKATAEPKPKYAVFNTGAEVREPAAHSSAAIKKAAKRMQLPDNFVWGTNGKGLDPEFVCTKDNLIALYNFVQPEWEKCKDSVNYIQSNKCADPTTPGCESMLAQSNTTEAAPEQQSSPSVLGWISKEVAHSALASLSARGLTSLFSVSTLTSLSALLDSRLSPLLADVSFSVSVLAVLSSL